MTPQEIEKMMDDKIKRAFAYGTKKYGDTPTDDLQLTPKKYVDSVAGAPAGPDGSVQFNDDGIMGGETDLRWNKNTDALIIDNGVSINLNTIEGGLGNSIDMQITGNTGGVGSVAGRLLLLGGPGNGFSGSGGRVEIRGGSKGALSGERGYVWATTSGGYYIGDTLTTSAIDGFLYIPTMPEAPIGTPRQDIADITAIVYDTTNNKLWAFNPVDTTWRSTVFT